MLDLLHIENIAVIEEADIQFCPGFNALTGETGAGKSIVIDAMGAVGLIKKRCPKSLRNFLRFRKICRDWRQMAFLRMRMEIFFCRERCLWTERMHAARTDVPLRWHSFDRSVQNF